MPTFDEIATFVREEAPVRGPLTAATSLQSDVGIYGMDIDDLLLAYSERFCVDMSGYIWYFHTGDEGLSPGSLFFRPPNKRVREIPITVGMLYDFAQLGRWALEYPEHKPPPRFRPDILINQLFVLAFIGFVVVMAIRGCAS